MADKIAARGHRVLVVDDEPQMLTIVSFALQTHGFDTVTAPDAERAWEIIAEGGVDLIVLDIMLPGESGLDVCRRLRDQHGTPVLLLTARDEQEDRLIGLEAGADDYLVKPFHPRELALRAAGILHRATRTEPRTFVAVRDLRIGILSMTVTLRGMRLSLSTTEYAMLLCLARHAGQVMSWRELVRQVWGSEPIAGDRQVVRTVIYRLRGRLGASSGDQGYVVTVRGAGYLMPAE